MEFILVGQPNCGKSTIFNEVAGYKSISTNISGATVEYTKGTLEIDNNTFHITDLPGIYSLQVTDEAEYTAVDYLLHSDKECMLINIIDASVLSRSLELTLQLMELKKPMILVLNMIDESEKKKISIDPSKLSKELGMPVVTAIGKKGIGVSELFQEAYVTFKNNIIAPPIIDTSELEQEIAEIEIIIQKQMSLQELGSRFLATRLIEKDNFTQKIAAKNLTESDIDIINSIVKRIENTHGKNSENLLSSKRHDLAFILFEKVATVGKPLKKDSREKIDNVLMHPFWGYFFLVVILYSIFTFIFKIGSSIEPFFVDNIAAISTMLATYFGKNSIAFAIANGIFQGIGGGIGIVVPFLLPFFIFLALLEDTGYLARIAFLTDNIMHQLGLHGMSVIPMIMGYGCTVPGILATRILKSRRDKFITATLATLVPCSARMTVIFGLVGFFISMKAAIFVYVINLLLIGLIGKFMSKAMPEISPGLLMEIPRYNLPTVKMVLKKTWFRMKEFIIIAWPILIAGSVVLEVIHFFKLAQPINSWLSPFTTGLLGLPAVVGITLIFGIMRKELSLILLFAALGTKDINTVMTPTQIYVFTFFVTFYIPCLATFAALARELDLKKALFIVGLTFIIAIILSVAIRLVVPLIA